jgi:Zn-dependent protease
MTPTNQGSIRLFRFAGIEVFLHWSWLLVALYSINQRADHYTSLTWNVLEYLALFCIVLLHEFGHSLACRQVGGHAERIVLWPLGGVAYVQPPERPGATLWSIAAGPLVNVILIPVFLLVQRLMHASGVAETAPDLYELLGGVAFINIVLLIFNLLPIYPLDGGQILRSLLWFLIGRARSLIAVAVIGFIGVGALVLLAVAARSVWIGIIAVFILFHCWEGLRHGLQMVRQARRQRRAGFSCPVCRMAPPVGAFCVCGNCRNQFDPFETQAVCPHCGAAFAAVPCLACRRASPINEWRPLVQVSPSSGGDSSSEEPHGQP